MNPEAFYQRTFGDGMTKKTYLEKLSRSKKSGGSGSGFYCHLLTLHMYYMRALGCPVLVRVFSTSPNGEVRLLVVRVGKTRPNTEGIFRIPGGSKMRREAKHESTPGSSH